MNERPLSPATFIAQALDLKLVLRQGWVDRGVTDVESVADHSWSVALLAWLLAGERPDLDRERVLLLGLVHDLPEVQAGDATPFDEHRDATGAIDPSHFVGVPQYSSSGDDAKRRRELSALDGMLANLSPDIADQLRNAWLEYDDDSTAEARFVKQVDKLETVIQALRYKRAQPDIIIDSFIAGARRDITDPDLVALLEACLAER